MGDSYRPLVSYDMGVAGIVEVTPTPHPDPLTPTPSTTTTKLIFWNLSGGSIPYYFLPLL
eukprot:COSAG01_NODE_2334_length_7882_cov_105.499807_5_plen_60_part_00